MIFNSICAVAAAALTVLPAATLAATPINERTAQEVVKQLNLEPNVEKGYYSQTFEDPDKVNNRSVSTLIYYLLEGSDHESVWHRVDATEVWHYYAGAPLTLSLSNDDGKPVDKHLLGQDFFNGQSPQVVIPKNTWQRARSHGDWTLVGNTVAPGFSTDGYELAPKGWHPRGSCQPPHTR